MPTLPEILTQFQFITQEVTLLGLFLTAGIILMGRDWRILILTLLVQYILVGLLLSRLVRPDIATLKVMIGAFICPILFLSARQVSVSIPTILHIQDYELETNRHQWWRRVSDRISTFLWGQRVSQGPLAGGFAFRLLVLLLIILVATTLSNSFILPNLTSNMSAAVYGLILAGLVTLGLSENPLKMGHGLLTILAGFDLFYSTLETSLLLTGLWGAVNLLIALALSYIIVVNGAGTEEEI